MSVPRWVWLLALGGLLLLLAAYALTAHAAGDGAWVLPLDDAYIHQQYACQLADGAWYQYNTGDLPTSGATSFIYPYLLAIGCGLGWRELSLAWWAVLIGALGLWLSSVAVYALARVFVAQRGAVFAMLLFLFASPLAWHTMSGMETLLMVTSTLWVVLGFALQKWRVLLVSLVVLGVTRPEGAPMVLVVLTAVLLERERWQLRRRWKWWLLPLGVLTVQPLVNVLFTGSWVATGNQSKSILATLPPDWGSIASRVLINWAQMWREFLLGDSAIGVLYTPPLLGVVALFGLAIVLHRRDTRLLAVVMLLWLLGVSLAIATLDNAFWHFKRYQVPLLALLYPLAAWGAWALRRWRALVWGGVLVAFVSLPMLTTTFLSYYAQNVGYVVAQPLAMARWLRANTPPTALVAVHDVGMMRYMGQRATLDMVGLTSRGLASYWRNSVGSVVEALRHARPDYIASYGRGHGYGLAYLEATRLYAQPLAVFDVGALPPTNVALAASVQAIYQPDWEAIGDAALPVQASSLHYLGWLSADPRRAFALATEVNVADIASEAAADYSWQSTYVGGFISEAYDFETVGCAQNCRVLDGGRRLNGRERFDVALDPQKDALLITRVHPQHDGTLDVAVNGVVVATRTLPAQAGMWLELATWLPREQLRTHNVITLTPNVGDGYYMPYYHWVYQGDMPSLAPTPAKPLVVYGQNAVLLRSWQAQQVGARLDVTLNWQVRRELVGDYRLFVHLYENKDAPPLAQCDGCALGGGLTLGNWLLGDFSDTISLAIGELPSGSYTLALGFYQPQTGERLVPQVGAGQDGRVWLGTVEMQAHDR